MKTKNLSVVLLISATLSLTSCATLFTPTKQKVTFTGESGIGIYDGAKKLGETDKDGMATVRVRKQLSTKTLFAKKEGYAKTPIQVEAVFNPVSILNLFSFLGWGVDAATGKMFKYDSDVIEIEMRKKED